VNTINNHTKHTETDDHISQYKKQLTKLALRENLQNRI